jgi:hypothetical protein
MIFTLEWPWRRLYHFDQPCGSRVRFTVEAESSDLIRTLSSSMRHQDWAEDPIRREESVSLIGRNSAALWSAHVLG